MPAAMNRARAAVVIVALGGGIASAFVDGVGGALLYHAAAGTAVVATWVGALRRPAPRPWLFLAGALTLWLGGDLVWDWLSLVHGAEPVASGADVLYLSGYPLLAVGVAGLVKHQAEGPVREGMLDGLALAVSGWLVAWTFLVAPYVGETESLAERVTLAAYPVADVFVIAVVGWLLLAPGRRTASTTLVVGFVLSELALDIGWAILPIVAPDASTDLLNGLFPVSYALLAAAALSVREPSRVPGPNTITAPMHPVRIAVLGSAMLAVPGVAVLAPSMLHAAWHRSIYLASSASLFVVVLVRLVLDVRARVTAQAALVWQATHDSLTGLVNRSMLLDRLDHALTRAERSGGALALFYVDLDEFKTVNDTFGHRAGDEILRQTASRLTSVVRRGDTVARVGGDEFVVLCESVDDDSAVLVLAERLVDALNVPVSSDGHLVPTAASVGVSTSASGSGGETRAELLADADAAMYRAKRNGGSRWEMADEGMREWAFRRRETEEALKRAVEHDELRLEYQPIVDTSSLAIVGFEALVRWERPGRGTVWPADFVPLAEETGLIVPIGEWVLRRACLQVAEWNRERPAPFEPLQVSVNVSGRQCNRPDLAATVAGIVAETGVDPSWLVLEITETVLVGRGRSLATQLAQLQEVGVRVAVDDFGTGYSSLAYLRSLPLDVLKVDRAFVSDLDVDGTDRTVVNAVVALAHALGLLVVAEGVETPAQLEALREIGCDRAQGFLLARPVPADHATSAASATSASIPAATPR